MKLPPSIIEALEARIAPASFSFLDFDQDMVKVTTSKGTDPHLQTATHTAATGISLLDLSAATWGTEFAGASVVITVTKVGAAPGDGLIHVGEIDATGIDLGSVTVKGDLAKILAGSAVTATSVKSLTVLSMGVLGMSTGAPDLNSTFAGGLGNLKVNGDVNAAHIHVLGTLGSVTLGGSLIGGGLANSGRIDGNTTKASNIKIGGDIQAGGDTNSGSLDIGDAASIKVGGSIVGGGSGDTGVIDSSGKKIGSIFVGGSITGGGGGDSGEIDVSGTAVGSIVVGGSLIGGGGGFSGEIDAGSFGSVKIGGDIKAGGAGSSGRVSSNGDFGSIIVGGSVLGTGGSGAGEISAVGKLGSVTVGGSLSGNKTSGGIRAMTIGKIVIKGSLIGTSSPVKIEATGFLTPPSSAKVVAIKSISVGGNVQNALILAGDFFNPDVQVGSVNVHGDWTTSSLVVGAHNLGTDDAAGGIGAAADNLNFGDSHDFANTGGSASIVARIASISIGGQVRGTGMSSHFGFVAEEIGSFKVAGTVIPLTAGRSNDNHAIGQTGDVTIHEV